MCAGRSSRWCGSRAVFLGRRFLGDEPLDTLQLIRMPGRSRIDVFEPDNAEAQKLAQDLVSRPCVVVLVYEDAGGPQRAPELLAITRCNAADVGEDDEVPLRIAEREIFFAGHKRADFRARFFGLLARDSDAGVRWIDAGDIPALACQENGIAPLAHADVERLAGRAALNRSCEEIGGVLDENRLRGGVDAVPVVAGVLLGQDRRDERQS